jgi:hypothetical protein
MRHSFKIARFLTRHSDKRPRPRQRSDRIGEPMSLPGTKLTSQLHRQMSVIGGKAEAARTRVEVA